MSRDYIQQHARRKAASQKDAGGAQGAARPTPVLVVCGLGNPGAEYAHTRHNVGFMVVDRLAELWGASYWKTTQGLMSAEVEAAGRKVALVKPTSYMNVSGGPVKRALEERHAPPTGLLVVHDDLELAAGTVAFKVGGGHGGHNGLRSIAEKLATRDFCRVRCGIGRPPGRMDPADFVLKELRGRDLDDFTFMVDEAAMMARRAVEDGR